MMSLELVTVRPAEIKFVFEVNQQSSCSIQLINNSEEHVAFKVKTTSPKKYCVRPNTGIMLPKSVCEFTVTMQAQKTAPPEMQCKDKFLIQSTVVSSGSTEDDLTSSLFAKDSGKYIQENKMRVLLVSPPHSPVLVPINGVLKQDQPTFDDPVFRGPSKQEPTPHEVPVQKESLKEREEVDDYLVISGYSKEDEEVSSHHEDHDLIAVKSSSPSISESEESRFKVGDLQAKLHDLERNVKERETIISKLREEKSAVMVERELLKEELLMFKSKANLKVQAGFPPLFVCFVALVSMYLGFLLSS